MYLKYLVLIVLILIIFVLLRHYNNNNNENKEGFQDAPGITWCANENGMCSSVDSGSTIIYGAGIGWTHKQFPNGGDVMCNTTEFGRDPRRGKAKECYKVPAGIEFAANEGETETINVDIGDTVYYGQKASWTSKTMNNDGSVECKTAVFGSDPISGQKKMCFVKKAPPTTTTPMASTTTPMASTTTPMASTTTPMASTTTPMASTTTPMASTTTPMASTTTPMASTTTPVASTTLPPSASTTLPPFVSTTLPPVASTTLPPSASTTTPFATSTTPQNVSSTVSPSGFNFSDPTELKVLETNNFNTGSDLQFRIDGNVTETQLLMIKSFIQ